MKKKKLLWMVAVVLLITLALNLITGCGEKPPLVDRVKDKDNIFIATILQINDIGVIVQAEEDNYQFEKGTKIAFQTKNLEEIDISVGTEVKILYSGTTIDLDPLIVDALSWKVNEEGKVDHSNQTKKEVCNIIQTRDDGDMEAEKFYEDDNYIYRFSFRISDATIVVYTDGSTENVKTALKNGNIQISDLDTYGIQYRKEPKN